jgi:hypothetical protein
VSAGLGTKFSEEQLTLDQKKSIVTAFFDHEYWHRRWIVQEIALAQPVTIFCVGKTMPLARVKSMAKEWNQEESLALRLCLLQQSDTKLGSTLPELLSTYRATRCEDFRDKVFALLSLADGAAKVFHISYDMTQAELLGATVEYSSAVQ